MSLDLIMLRNRSRSLSASFNSMRSKMSTKSKSQSHYDTLGVNNNATQNEIKSAYFKLTKQYHPDVNKHISAKEQFQSISEAYQVIGNYHSRKQYDRVVPEGQNSTTECAHSNFNSNSNTMHNRARGNSVNNSHIYDFDEWTRVHYGRKVRHKYMRRVIYENFRKEEKKNDEELDAGKTLPMYLTFFIVLCMIINLNITTDKHDKSR